MRNLLATILLLSLPLVGGAQEIFKTTDADGNVVFTDQPPAGTEGEKVELKRTNTAAPTQVRQAPPDSAGAPTEVESFEYSVRILSPDNETTIAMGPGNFSVSAAVDPAPRDGEVLQLQLDGENWGEPQQATSWALTNVFRGAHDLTVSVVDAEGEPLATSDPVRVYVLRPSVNFRN